MVGSWLPPWADGFNVTDAHTKKPLAALAASVILSTTARWAFSHDGKHLAAKGGTNVLIWEVGRWLPYQRLSGVPNGRMATRPVFPDGRRFVTRVKGGLGVWTLQRGRGKSFQGRRVSGSSCITPRMENGWLSPSGTILKILNAQSHGGSSGLYRARKRRTFAFSRFTPAQARSAGGGISGRRGAILGKSGAAGSEASRRTPASRSAWLFSPDGACW
jgi:hypothetical protein